MQYLFGNVLIFWGRRNALRLTRARPRMKNALTHTVLYIKTANELLYALITSTRNKYVSLCWTGNIL
jgi:hypothetical protein